MSTVERRETVAQYDLTDNDITYRVVVAYNFMTKESKCTILHPNGVDIICGNESDRLHTIFIRQYATLVVDKQDRKL